MDSLILVGIVLSQRALTSIYAHEAYLKICVPKIGNG